LLTVIASCGELVLLFVPVVLEVELEATDQLVFPESD